RRLNGIDREKIMSQHTATVLARSIIVSDVRQILQASLLPFPLALTLAFSAKESVYKAFSDRVTLPGFNSAKVTSLTATHISLHLLPAFAATMAERTVRTEWFQRDNSV
ncbi:4'-phosphopantetheinyl transferase superfamily protein, partial [Escherichia coli]|uniref:4'-phosphopantetheinyl transferase superfamily protein n=1 Tax=Escherichia coli TaxID=562 RepID=UPI0021C87FDE